MKKMKDERENNNVNDFSKIPNIKYNGKVSEKNVKITVGRIFQTTFSFLFRSFYFTYRIYAVMTIVVR